MKHTILKSTLLATIFLFGIGCGSQQEKVEHEEAEKEVVNFPKRAQDMTLYEVNIRQYTPEGTIKAFIPHLSRLNEMGIDMLWIMPIQPIGKEKRKGSLGSYYSINNYTEVNPEFGTLADFKMMVDSAHALGMDVMLDWVANHTAFDHHWIKDNPEFYTKDSLGNIIPPVEDWSDVADLNYDNDSLRKSMTAAMKYWIREADIDGFRCDVAGMVPNDFWETAIQSLRAEKNIFMLAEWDTPEIHEAGFDMSYGWEFLHLINDIAKGHKNANDLEAYLAKEDSLYYKNAVKMYFTTNHDENSWSGTVFSRLDSAYKAMTVLTFTLEGMPLIYSGQEAGLNKSLAFFEKDTISWDQLPYEGWFSKLTALKANNPELWNACYGGELERIETTNQENIFAFTRTLKDQQSLVIVNLSGDFQRFSIDNSFHKSYIDQLTGYDITFDGNEFSMDPWSYYVLQEEKDK